MINENLIYNLIDNFVPFTNAETTQTILQYAKISNNTNIYVQDKTVYILVGPSGSGKSTFIANMYKLNIFGNSTDYFVPFINRHYSNISMSLGEEIAFKVKLLKKGCSFLIESANFDVNYTKFIKEMKTIYGYCICLIYLTKHNPKENLEMVLKRKAEGGHGTESVELNEEALNNMYSTDRQSLIEILPYCNSCFVIKTSSINSCDSRPIILMQKKLNGDIVYNKEYRYAIFLYEHILKDSNINLLKSKVRNCKPNKSISKWTLKEKYTHGHTLLDSRINKIISVLKEKGSNH